MLFSPNYDILFHYSSSFSSNVPSPAPNGQVPSPAPEDQNKSVAPDSAGIGGGRNSNTTNKLGAQLRNSKPQLDRNLSTIPEGSTERELNNNNQLINKQNSGGNGRLPGCPQSVLVSQPPDLLVHSGNNRICDTIEIFKRTDLYFCLITESIRKQQQA